jgi:hypothetical protein
MDNNHDRLDESQERFSSSQLPFRKVTMRYFPPPQTWMVRDTLTCPLATAASPITIGPEVRPYPPLT